MVEYFEKIAEENYKDKHEYHAAMQHAEHYKKN